MTNTTQQLLTVLAVPPTIAALKGLVPSIPKHWLPVIAPVLASLADGAAQLCGASTLGPVAAALLGSAGVGLREVYDQAKKRMESRRAPSVPLSVILTALAGVLVILPGCAKYSYTSSRGEKTSFTSFLMMGKANSIRSTTAETNGYKRTVSVGSIDGQTETEKLGALMEAVAAGAARGAIGRPRRGRPRKSHWWPPVEILGLIGTPLGTTPEDAGKAQKPLAELQALALALEPSGFLGVIDRKALTWPDYVTACAIRAEHLRTVLKLDAPKDYPAPAPEVNLPTA